MTTKNYEEKGEIDEHALLYADYADTCRPTEP